MSHARIIDELGGSAELAALLGIGNPSTVAHWRNRGIPPARWFDIEKASGGRVTAKAIAECSPQALPQVVDTSITVSPPPDPAFLPTPLTGASVSLIPLNPAHHDALIAAATDGALWQLWYTGVPEPDGMAAEIARRLALQQAGTMAPFTVLAEPGGHVVGMTSYMNIDAVHRRVEIGSTWVAPRVQRTSLNTEAKLLLLTHAFDTLHCIAVEFRTHFLNQQSRRAIERLGAKLDGVLRCHQRGKDGTLRDTCVYSITAAEWPAIHSHLQWKLSQPR
jgi:RimJ/RimL family protein N-acetyltransferase/DNA-binding transcriptional regulator YdaS (Cro superfamily)